MATEPDSKTVQFVPNVSLLYKKNVVYKTIVFWPTGVKSSSPDSVSSGYQATNFDCGAFWNKTHLSPRMQQPAKGYKEERPADVIQMELSKLSYISSIGEVENSKLERQQKKQTPNINPYSLTEPPHFCWNEWEINTLSYQLLLE